MRWPAGIAAAGAVALAAGCGGGDSQDVRVDAVFDSAKGMVPGQLVKVGGARVGTIEAVRLEGAPGRGYRARLELSVSRRAGPFRADATCKVLPEGIISENYVECDPGSPRAGRLAAGKSGVPTIPLRRTAVALSLQDILNVFAAPAPERLRVLINELGLATAGRGADLSAVLRRSNPALTQARKVLAIVNRDQVRIDSTIAQTGEVMAELSGRSAAVRGFVSSTAEVTRATASRSQELGEAVRRLPAALTAVERSLVPVRRLSEAGAPVLDDLRAAAPQLERLNSTVPAFTRPARPALAAVGAAAARGTKALPRARPAVASLRTLAARAPGVSELLDDLLVSTRDGGGFEGLGDLVYGLATGTAGYDRVSHFVTILALAYPQCVIENLVPGRKPSPGCSHAYTDPHKGQLPARNLSESTGAEGMPRTRPRVTAKPADVEAVLDYLLK